MLPIPQLKACASLHTAFPKSFNNSFVKKLISEIFRAKELLQSESLLKCINNHSFGLFTVVQRLTGAWFEDHRLLDEMCLFSSTPESVLCTLMAKGRIWPCVVSRLQQTYGKNGWECSNIETICCCMGNYALLKNKTKTENPARNI